MVSTNHCFCSGDQPVNGSPIEAEYEIEADLRILPVVQFGIDPDVLIKRMNRRKCADSPRFS